METLTARLVRGGPIPEADAVGWAVRLARAVEPAHERLGEHGRLSADAIVIEADACTSEGNLIEFAALPSNPAYHSPERVRGGSASQADDTWAVAVTLYFALSGTLPFAGSTPEEVRRKVTSVPAPPLAVFDVGDDALQDIVARALATDASGRTSSLAALRGELEGWLSTVHRVKAGALPPLLGGEDEEEVTMIQMGPPSQMLRKQIDSAIAAAAKAAPAPPPREEPPPPASAPSPPSQPASSRPAEAPDPEPVSAAPPPSEPPASAVPPSQGAPAPILPAQTAPASRTANLVAAVLGIVLGLAGIAFFLFWHKEPDDAQTPPAVASTTPPPASAPPSSVSVPTASVSASVSASTSAPHAPTAAPAAHTPGDLAACVTSMFPAESFSASPDFAFLCTETDPLKGAAAVRAEMVRAHKNESVAMAEWALLGWYDLAAFSVMRGHCCASPPPLKTAEVPQSCDPVPEVLASIDKAVAQAKSPSDEAVQKAVDAYTHDIYCIVRVGIAARFGRVDKPQGGEDSAFKRFVARVIQAR